MDWLKTVSDSYSKDVWPDAERIAQLKFDYLDSLSKGDELDMDYIIEEVERSYTPSVHHFVDAFSEETQNMDIEALLKQGLRFVSDSFITEHDPSTDVSFTQSHLKSGLKILAHLRNMIAGTDDSIRLSDEILHSVFLATGMNSTSSDTFNIQKLFYECTGITSFNLSDKNLNGTSNWFADNIHFLMQLNDATWSQPVCLRNTGDGDVVLAIRGIKDGKIPILHYGVSSEADVTELSYDWNIVELAEPIKRKLIVFDPSMQPVIVEGSDKPPLDIETLVAQILRSTNSCSPIDSF